MRELGRKVGLSAPAVTERVRRLEEEGVISGYSAKLVPARLGRQITAFIGVQDSGQRDPQLIHWSEEHPAVLECHSVTGENSHHMIEGCFKGVGRALRQAVHREGEELPSTKGVL